MYLLEARIPLHYVVTVEIDLQKIIRAYAYIACYTGQDQTNDSAS